MERTKRIECVDIVKYVCIIMVMLSHLESRTDIWSAFYTPFFYLVFSLLQGMCINQKAVLRTFYIKKFDNYLCRG